MFRLTVSIAKGSSERQTVTPWVCLVWLTFPETCTCCPMSKREKKTGRWGDSKSYPLRIG